MGEKPNAKPLMIVGRVCRAHGIRGEVVVEVLTEAPDTIFAPGARVFAGLVNGDPGPNPRTLSIEAARPFLDRLLVAFEEIPDRTDAERWRDRYLLVPEDEIQPPREGEVFVHQLAGLNVVRSDGTPVGRVIGTFDVAGRLLLEVQREGGTVLLPYETAFVERLDMSTGQLVMSLPDGLLS